MFGLAFVSGVPTWLLAGLVLGALFATLILIVFLAGERLAPTDGPDPAGDDRRARGETLRREEIRYYLQAAGESFEEDAVVEGHDVAFLLPERDVAVTFDARTFLLLRESSLHPILVEHEMPGVHIGTRLPFETPDVGLGPDAPDAGTDRRDRRTRASASASTGATGTASRWRDTDARERGKTATDSGGAHDPEAVRAAYAALGLPPTADDETVRSAYRERLKNVHPDHGGTREAFARVQEAYATIADSRGEADDQSDAPGSDSL